MEFGQRNMHELHRGHCRCLLGALIHYYFSPVVNHIFFLFSSLGGETYFESVCMGANLGAMAFHGQYYRRKFGKLGIVVLAGKPNVGKSKEIMTALHCSSSLQYFFAKVDIEINCDEFFHTKT